MFEGFTYDSRVVLVRAQEEARYHRHNHIGVEHMLLGVLGVEEAIAARTLNQAGLTLDKARKWVRDELGYGEPEGMRKPMFTPGLNEALELAFKSALIMGHDYIVPGHILAGLIKTSEQHEGPVGRMFLHFGIEARAVLRETEQRLRDREDAPERVRAQREARDKALEVYWKREGPERVERFIANLKKTEKKS